MTTNGTDLHAHARAYIDSVLESQRQAGHEPQISNEAYESAINRVEEAFVGLTDRNAPEPDESLAP